MTGNYRQCSPETPLLYVDDFLSDPPALRATLEERGALNFNPYRSGLFPACELPEDLAVTGMPLAWLRDNAFVGEALYKSDRPELQELGINVGHALLQVLCENRDSIDGIVSGRYDRHDPQYRIPARVDGATLQRDAEPRVQNDAVGAVVRFVSQLMQNRVLSRKADNMDTIAQTANYLGAIEFWQDLDQGYWEEQTMIHSSSISTAVAGLTAALPVLESAGHHNVGNVEMFADKGRQSYMRMMSHCVTEVTSLDDLRHIQPRRFVEGVFDSKRRPYDASLLFSVEPFGVFKGQIAQKVIHDTQRRLVRERGTIRYVGDTYWMPDFKDLMSIEERTSSAPGRQEWRDSFAVEVASARGEAQWTLFDSMLASHFGKMHAETASSSVALFRRNFFLQRMLNQLVETGDGSLQFPELFYRQTVAAGEQQEWVPNDHQPLLWAQAGALTALKTFEDTA